MELLPVRRHLPVRFDRDPVAPARGDRLDAEFTKRLAEVLGICAYS